MADTYYTTITWTAGDIITEAKMDSMVANDRAVDSMAQGVEFLERANPSTPAANKLHVFAKDAGGRSKLYQIDDTGEVERVGFVHPILAGQVELSQNSNIDTGGSYSEAGDGDDEVSITTTKECKFVIFADRRFQPNSDTGRSCDIQIQMGGVDVSGGFGNSVIAGYSGSNAERKNIIARAVTTAQAAGTYTFRLMQRNEAGKTTTFTGGTITVIALPTGSDE